MKVVAIKERSIGNEQVGEMWNDTAIFNVNAPIGEVLTWAKQSKNPGGRLMLTIPDEVS